jgi:hypothetical protein
VKELVKANSPNTSTIALTQLAISKSLEMEEATFKLLWAL